MELIVKSGKQMLMKSSLNKNKSKCVVWCEEHNRFWGEGESSGVFFEEVTLEVE